MSWEEDLEQVGKDPAAGARLLLASVEYLRRGEALPDVLAAHIAGAFEVAAHKETEAERVAMLGRELGLVRERAGRPKKATVDDARWADAVVDFSDDLPGTKADVERLIMWRTGVKERTAAQLIADLKKLREQDIEALRAGMRAWCETASYEQLEVFRRTDDMLDHPDAVAMLECFSDRP